MQNQDIKKSPLHIGIIGGGPAGYVAALYAAAQGAQVTLVEKGGMGGTCLQKGCIPTKRLVTTSHLLTKMKAADKFGISVAATPMPNWEKIQSSLLQLVKKIEKDLQGLLQNRHVALLQAQAKPYIDEDDIRIELANGEQIPVDRLLICSGSAPHQPTNFPFDGEQICTSDDIWQWTELPRSLLIIGEGVIGCEFAFIFRSMGIDVTLLGMQEKPLPNMDRSVSSIILREMKKNKIRFKGGRLVSALELIDGQWQAYSDNELLGAAERVLVCTGRVPYTQGLQLSSSPIECEANACIKVDQYMATNIPHVYAAGDVTGGIMLAHAASEQARVAVDHMLGKAKRGYDVKQIPMAIFTTPEVASIGLTETQALQQGLDISCGIFDMRALGKAQAMGEIAGAVKLIAEQHSRRLLGAHIVAANATEMIHEAAIVITRQGSVDEIMHTVHAHPTLSEGLLEAAEDVFGQACHKPIIR